MHYISRGQICDEATCPECRRPRSAFHADPSMILIMPTVTLEHDGRPRPDSGPESLVRYTPSLSHHPGFLIPDAVATELKWGTDDEVLAILLAAMAEAEARGVTIGGTVQHGPPTNLPSAPTDPEAG